MFIAYGPGITNPLTLDSLFVKPAVVKVAKSSETVGIQKDDTPHHDSSASAYRSEKARHVYQAIDQAVEAKPALKAKQVMTTPVFFLQDDVLISDVKAVLEANDFRHIPVLAADGKLVGMISDRDIYRCLCATACGHCHADKQEKQVHTIMKDEVLAASVDSDVRYIARLLVEQRVGAMPIVQDDKLVGIVTRSDILRAVMLHFDLDVWQ